MLMSGFAYGGIAGITPGPLTMIILNEVLKSGARNGYIVVFVSILLCEPIIIALCLGLSSFISNQFLAWLSVFGACFILYIAWETFKESKSNLNIEQLSSSKNQSGSIQKTIKRVLSIQFFNPHAYVFWSSVAAPQVILEYRSDNTQAIVVFFIAFFSTMIGIKALLVWSISKGTHFLTGNYYRYTLVASALILTFLAGQLFLNAADILDISNI